MHPVLIKIGAFELHSYGLMLAISFVVGIYWAMARAEKRGVSKNVIMDLSLLTVLCAILGSRFFYVITHTAEFQGHWLNTINPVQSDGTVGLSGLSMLGGVLCVILAIVIFCMVKKIPILTIIDIIAPSFALGIGITRIGCFLNGCCYGVPGHAPWCMVFPPNSPAGYYYPDIPIHPTQLYASLYGFLILAILILLDRKPRFQGFIASVFLMLYGLARFSIDFIRDYEASVQFHLFGKGITYNQLITFGMFLAGLILLFLQRYKHRQEE